MAWSGCDGASGRTAVSRRANRCRKALGSRRWRFAASRLEGIDRNKAETWTIEQTGRESGWVNRLRLWMLGADSDDTFKFDGWAWYPGTAAWVGPTAISILALQKLEKRGGGGDSASLKKRIDQGRGFLLARRCRDGGWNHGSTRALGYDSDSYPETTGLALLALHGVNGPEVAQGLVRGEQHLASCQSSEAASWLRLGLGARRRPPPPWTQRSLQRRRHPLPCMAG